MAEGFGAITVPIGTTPDPALAILGDYFKTIVNLDAKASWEERPFGDEEVIKTVFGLSPNGRVFDSCLLPALFVYRTGGLFSQTADDWLEDSSVIKLAWLLPISAVDDVDIRREFFKAFAVLVAKAARRGRDTRWQWDADDQAGAITVAASPDSIALAHATSLTAQTLSGAALDGQLGAVTEHKPRLIPTITTDLVGVDTYNVTTPITFTVVDWYGRTKTLTKRLTLIRGGETLVLGEDVKRIASVDEPAMLSTLGQIRYGNRERVGIGSSVRRLAGLSEMRPGPWRILELTLNERNGDADPKAARAAVYEAVEIDLVVREIETVDRADRTAQPYGAPAHVEIDSTIDEFLLAERDL